MHSHEAMLQREVPEESAQHYVLPSRQQAVLLFTPRSGSSWLARMMSNTGVLGIPDEYLNPELMPPLVKRFSARTESDYLNALQQTFSTPNNVFSLKVDAFHIDHFNSLNFFDYFANAKFIWLRRKSILDQGISLMIAVETGMWHRRSVDERQPEIGVSDENLAKIAEWCAHILEHECRMEIKLLTRGIHPFRIFYEDVVSNTTAIVRDIAQFVLGPEDHIEGIVSEHYKVGSAININFRTKFKKAYPDFLPSLKRLRPPLLRRATSL